MPESTHLVTNAGVFDNCFVITGPPGSGKTPILTELAAMGFAVVPEPAREVIAHQRSIHGTAIYDKDPALFWKLMLSRAISDLEAALGTSSPVFFDRGIPDLIGNAELFGHDASEAVQASDRCRYNDCVFVLPSWREIYVTDEDRRMTFEAAEAFGERVRDVYEDFGYTIIDVPRDTIAARAEFVVDAMRTSARN